MIKEPTVHFTDWRNWIARDRLADIKDIPKDFGVLGIYLLAAFESSDPPESESTARHLHPDVIYIGMSENVTKRVDKHHGAVHRYRQKSMYNKTAKLYCCDWQSQWTNFDKRPPELACIRYIERKLIWEFANMFNRMPEMNLQ